MKIALDLDGTLLQYTPGMGARGDFGQPVPSTRSFAIAAISRGHELLCFTARQRWQHKDIHAHLDKLGIRMPVTSKKEMDVDVWIDDRAINFHNQVLSCADIEAFRPWWER